MAAHALLSRRGSITLTRALVGALVAFSPGVALACPYCAGRAGSGVGTGIVLGSFVMLPFLVVWIIYRVIRAEARAGDPSMLDVAETLGDRPILKAPVAKAPRGPVFSALLHNRSRREAE